MKIRKYLLNCFLLLIHIFIWNIFLVDYLPKGYNYDIFWKDVPRFIGYGENIFRIIVFVLPVVMMLSFKTRTEKIGLLIYLVGIVIYFLSWIIMISFPVSTWSRSALGFMAPAYTTIIWLIGIGLIGNRSFFRIPKLSQIYIYLSMIFVFFHTLHTYIIFLRL